MTATFDKLTMEEKRQVINRHVARVSLHQAERELRQAARSLDALGHHPRSLGVALAAIEDTDKSLGGDDA